MTPKEFRAWFEGFVEGMDGMPTPAQWARVKARVAEIDGTPITYPVYVDRYWPRIPQIWSMAEPVRHWDLGAGATYLANGAGFDGVSAMYALGKAEQSD